MHRLRTPLHWLAVVWLALAPALAAAHEHQHADPLLADDLACVLCQAADRDDDGVPPASEALTQVAVLLVPELPSGQVPRQAADGALPCIRGPPARA